ncbi:hypothetical protein Hokovirus_3_137 [Hokovirus HKV1]|uniref:Uncharacterized protein n=1 Tax=Hokovirus HKV1 TaxID=1977638 RepID=A0A1V0SGT8_9VIRU|nr:hypothetical protein Hokovirus_3_137 [Hokovirus HKV1]
MDNNKIIFLIIIMFLFIIIIASCCVAIIFALQNTNSASTTDIPDEELNYDNTDDTTDYTDDTTDYTDPTDTGNVDPFPNTTPGTQIPTQDTQPTQDPTLTKLKELINKYLNKDEKQLLMAIAINLKKSIIEIANNPSKALFMIGVKAKKNNKIDSDDYKALFKAINNANLKDNKYTSYSGITSGLFGKLV